MKEKGFGDLQERFRDPLLTALTIMLAVLLFVVGPLQAAGIAESSVRSCFISISGAGFRIAFLLRGSCDPALVHRSRAAAR